MTQSSTAVQSHWSKHFTFTVLWSRQSAPLSTEILRKVGFVPKKQQNA